jgi:cation/acetate symporter
MARIAAGVIGLIAILLAIPAQKLNVAFLVALAFAVAASANLPAIVYNLFWRRFNTRGAVWSIYGGLISSVGLVIFSPIMSGKGLDPTGKNLSLLPTSIDISWFPLENPGIVSIPLGFLAAWLGTMLSREPASEEMYDELRVRALTGLGAEEAEAAPTRATAPASRPTG